MCGRFTLTRQDRRELAQLLGVDEKDLRDYQPHYNIAPMQDHFVVPLSVRQTSSTKLACLINCGVIKGVRKLEKIFPSAS